ncbi:ABC transporter substrate-binding protein [Gemmatimonas aurantiaca]|uniref:ABC transporter substrate-binding protein n=1 Tax=Gemmatimonas aurantiaca TaxID=173480 RepID=UPI00301DA0C8
MIRSLWPILLVITGSVLSADTAPAWVQTSALHTSRAPLSSTTETLVQPIQLTDISGRKITLPRPASRVLIDDGRFLMAMALIDPDPVRTLVAWPRDVNRIGVRTHEQFRAKFPRLDSLTQIASSAATYSQEQVLRVRPDVAVFSLGQGPSADQIEQLQRVGIAVVFIDFFVHPLENTDPSLLILGQLTGRSAAAQAYVNFRKQHLQAISDRLKRAGTRTAPKVFVEVHAGISEECCHAPGKGNVGDYITFVGGHNIAADVLPGTTGKLNIEYVLSQNAPVYIETGGPHLEKAGGLVLGPGFTVEQARASLQKMTARPGISSLAAVKSGRTYGIAHQLLNSPLDILAVESMARWIDPVLFRDIDPAKTLAEINTKYLAVPIEGPQWISLR